ncbi:hypothetical protein B1987_00630 [Mycobacterium kansasii]|uniref:DUF732 domain-containing protein n=1 Tax=Mycobacterium attenuatum TaxID=2341086 RepID=A0A498Q207_9MYCO|nr:DUF732 domain-containing protein [Mycobacterium attenuatum]ORB87120.1 hypothetical protein B1987_00630 [Mycobacterium kansasii]VBA39327.1 hypothetical protein LAUMK136_02927 [Mycobacterium attenuatum]VBA58461.1 hypothetical protein LAUMK41_02975 [Mycobacterium attenuatum]
MFSGITSHVGALVTAVVVVTGTAVLRGGAAAADPNQDDQFLALLEKKEIPALSNVPRVIAAAHKVCRKLDAGMPVDEIVDRLRNDAYDMDPALRQYPPRRVTSTMTRFITAAVEIYCPYDRGKIASIAATPAPQANESARRIATYTPDTVNAGCAVLTPPASEMTNMATAWHGPTGIAAMRLPLLAGGAVVAGRHGDRSAGHTRGTIALPVTAVAQGDPQLPSPPQTPAPPPPTAHIVTPPPPMATPPPSRQSPPPPHEPPPQELLPPQEVPPPQESPPQEVVEPPADAPQPGAGGGSGAGGGGGSGGSGGAGPVQPSPTRPAPPGVIRLAP